MSNSYRIRAANWIGADFGAAALLRGTARMLAAFLWTVACCGCVKLVSLALAFFPATRRQIARRVARRWLKGMPRLLGLRLIEHGSRPVKPHVMVSNHISWADFITMNLICEARCVAMAEMKDAPFLGTLVDAMGAIFVRRVREDVPRVRQEVADTITGGGAILLAPEGTVTPGRTVRRFRAALLEPAARMQKPVSYASITYRTPEGYPPASQTVLFGPDPHFRPDDDEVNDLALWGPKRSFAGHFHRFVSVPYHEVHVRHGHESITDSDCIALANRLQQAVKALFAPLD